MRCSKGLGFPAQRQIAVKHVGAIVASALGLLEKNLALIDKKFIIQGPILPLWTVLEAQSWRQGCGNAF